MKTIILSQGKVALVDDDDFDFLNQWKWYASKGNNTWYAQRSGNKTTISMHRTILNPKKGYVCDHIDGNGLNNQKTNLRLATRSQNMSNRRSCKNSSSKYVGVTYDPIRKWRTMLKKDGKTYTAGTFSTEEEAARARDKKAIELFGEFANLNFPITEESTNNQALQTAVTKLQELLPTNDRSV